MKPQTQYAKRSFAMIPVYLNKDLAAKVRATASKDGYYFSQWIRAVLIEKLKQLEAAGK